MAGWQQAFGHGARMFGLAFHPNTSDVIASASEDETVRVWSRDSSSAWQQVGSSHTANSRFSWTAMLYHLQQLVLLLQYSQT
jgi:WD40 repeat protein